MLQVHSSEPSPPPPPPQSERKSHRVVSMMQATATRTALWSLPKSRVTLIITWLLLAGLAAEQAISLNSDQATSSKSESNSAGQAQSYHNAAQTQTPQPQMIKAPQAAKAGAVSAPITSTSTTATPSFTRKPISQHQANKLLAGGRVRKPTQASGLVAASGPTVSHDQEKPAVGGESSMDPLQDEIKRMMAEYRNTPPLFVTTTRDFFVDVARYPLGFKLATMQALDSEGDRIEYSLKQANYRDASPYFTINATTGELRLANKRIPLQADPSDAGTLSGEDDDDDEEQATDSLANSANNGRQLARSLADQSDSALEKPGYLYFLNVAANDGKYTSIVELQIHVFNSTSFGTKSPVQLTIEGGRRGSESAMRAKTNEFFERLYKPAGAVTQPANNSTLVFPSFINPGLAVPGHVQDDEFAATTAPSLAQLQTNDLGSAPTIEAQSAVPNLSAPFVIEPAAHQTDNGRRHVEAVMQQPMVLSFVIFVCSCFTVALVLLIFVVPLSVKRLKKRLKNMELQHEQLSQKASSAGSSIVCSSANSNHSVSSMTTGGHLASLSQFTLTGSERSGALMQLPSHHHHHHQHNQHNQPLGRQSSLDSAITSGGNFTGSCLSYQTQRYHPPQHNNDLNHVTQQQLLSNGLNRINNGAIVNPMYLHSQSAQMAHLGQPQTNELNNIYCPIDDDFYTTINNNELDSTVGTSTIAPSGVIVGQTYDSRNYFASQCAPLLQQQQQQPEQQAITIDNSDIQQRHQSRETDTPHSRSSSRSSTRSLARFLSLPARHWSHQQQQQQQQQQSTDQFGGQSGEQKQKRSFLEELEYHLSDSKSTVDFVSRAHDPNQAAKTIARANNIDLEQQVGKAKKAAKEQRQKQHVWELERHRLKFIDILDEGQFGLVWRCKLRSKETSSSGESSVERTVAVKTLKSFAAKDEREREELLAEIEIMKRVCEHPNVVKILHCCTQDISQTRPILLIMEHVELGKLQSFLEKSRTSHNYATTSSLYNHASQSMRGADYLASSLDGDDELRSSIYGATGEPCQLPAALGAPRQEQLTSRELIKFIYHVAKGMEYISSSCIVHRDLASRNILISAQRVCKIGDFGMARHMASACDIYERHSRNTKIPVRWMAPEVLLHNSFTTKSDVYSFGILMWEIVTLGSTPYASLKMDQIIEAVARAGQRPSKPDYCHSLLYNIMSQCWSAQPDERPTFGALVRQLDQLLLSTDEYIELDQYPDHNYYNISPAPGELV